MLLPTGNTHQESKNGPKVSDFLTKRIRATLWVITCVAALLIIVPTAYLVIWGFWGTDVVGRLRPFEKITFHWFWTILESNAWRISLLYSGTVAFVVSVLGVCITCLYSYCIRFAPRSLDNLTFAFISIVLLSPAIAFGLSLRFSGAMLGLPEWMILGIGHFVLILPLQFLVFEASRESVATEMLMSARTLGSSHISTFFTVYVPNMWLPIIGGIILAFFFSFDDIVVAVFVLDRAFITAPLRLWKGVSHQVTPDPAVISVFLIISFTIALAFYHQLERWLSRPRRRQR